MLVAGESQWMEEPELTCHSARPLGSPDVEEVGVTELAGCALRMTRHPPPPFSLRTARPPFRPSWEVARPLISCLALLSEFLARGPCPLFWEMACLPDPGVRAWLEAS